MPSPLKSRILQHVQHRSYQPQQVRQIAGELGVPRNEQAEFRQAVDELVSAGHVVLGASDSLALPPIGREVTGTFKLHERGFGFLIPDTPNSHGDLFVPSGHSGGALTGDRVRAEVRHDRRRGQRGDHSPYTGSIVEIIARKSTLFTGTLEKRGSTWVVFADGKMLSDPIVVRDVGAKNARAGDKVVVELTKFPGGRVTAEGVITEVLGEPGQPSVETNAIIRAFGLAEGFDDSVKHAARQIVGDYEGRDQARFFENRLDLRQTFTITIDPPDARDFDDAISIRRLADGDGKAGQPAWELGVHIADVATFVKPGGALDSEARQRGNSVYLPRVVLPMLPEILSNGICSLQPDVPRLTKSAIITYDSKGNVVNHRLANSVIQSNHRLTYLEAQALIDDKPEEAARHRRSESDYSDELMQQLQWTDMLARTIRKRRLGQGMITLDLPEVSLIFDDEGNVVDAEPEDDAFTHTIIEMFMVEANEAVARTFADLGVPLLRRIHPEPGAADRDELRQFARVAGYNIPANPSRKELQNLLEAVRGKPAARAVHLAILKTLTKAEYSPQLIGHFALASEHYAHFTSPIRRYPDLTVHRVLDALLAAHPDDKALPNSQKMRKKLANRIKQDGRCLDEEKLVELGRHCSATERNAEAAERELRDLLVMQMLNEKHVGDMFSGTVTGVTGFGVFVQIDKYLVEGLIKTTDLPGARGERWKLNEHAGSLTAQRSGHSITIGDQFKVQIVKVDLGRREMDLRIIEPPRRGKTSTKPKRGGRPGKVVRRKRRKGRSGK